MIKKLVQLISKYLIGLESLSLPKGFTDIFKDSNGEGSSKRVSLYWVLSLLTFVVVGCYLKPAAFNAVIWGGLIGLATIIIGAIWGEDKMKKDKTGNDMPGNNDTAFRNGIEIPNTTKDSIIATK